MRVTETATLVVFMCLHIIPMPLTLKFSRLPKKSRQKLNEVSDFGSSLNCDEIAEVKLHVAVKVSAADLREACVG